jgi:hypothetical protein
MRYVCSVRWLLVFVVGCGPIVYVNQVTNHAAGLVDQARHADAEHKSPYWFTRATQYLHLAHEDAARADFQGANHFGRLSAEAAQHALDDANTTAAAKPEPAVAPAPPALSPAKDAP